MNDTSRGARPRGSCAGNGPRILTFITALSLLSPSLALAQGKPEAKADKAAVEESRDRFKRGNQLYQEGSLDAALVEFKRAYYLAPNFKIQYNIGVVYRDQRNYVASLRAFERFLSEGGKQIDAAKKKEVDKEVDQLKKFVASVEIRANVDGAEVKVDEEVVGQTPIVGAVMVNAGTRKITAVKDGRLPASETVSIAGGDAKKIELTLNEPAAAPSAAPAPPPAAAPAPPPAPPPSKFTTLSYVGLGAAGALAIGAGVTGFMALGASKDLKDQPFVGDEPSSEVKDQQSKVKTLALTTDVLAGAAIVTAGVTLYLTLSRTPKAEAPAASVKEVRVGVRPGGAMLEGRF
jgi:hypothetical protein